jgi:hypothetical protein
MALRNSVKTWGFIRLPLGIDEKNFGFLGVRAVRRAAPQHAALPSANRRDATLGIANW